MTTQEKIDSLLIRIETNEGAIIFSGGFFECEEKKLKIIELLEEELTYKKRKLVELKEQLKAEQNTYNPNFQPAKGETYWTIDLSGTITKSCWCDDSFDNWHFINQNVFKTEAQAEKRKQAIELMAEIKEWATDRDIDSLKFQIYRIAGTIGIYHSLMYSKFGARIQQLKEYL